MTQEEPQVSGEQAVAAASDAPSNSASGSAADARLSGPAAAGDEMTAVRELILRAYPDVVPELVTGGTIGELQASVEPARAAYRQVAERIATSGASAPAPSTAPVSTAAGPTAPPSVPAGAVAAPVSLDGLPASELIKRGLAGARRRG